MPGPSIHPHLGTILPPLLSLASEAGSHSEEAEAAREAVRQVSAAVAEDGAYLLIAQVIFAVWKFNSPKSPPLNTWIMGTNSLVVVQLEKGLEEPTRRRAAAVTIAHYCSASKHDFQEHVPSLLTVSTCMQ